MIRDTKNIPVPVLAPKRLQAVTATEAWTPGADDRVFACTVPQGIKLNGGTEFPWPEAVPLGIQQGMTYTFSTTSTILVE